VTITPRLLGSWAVHAYGSAPLRVKVDALTLKIDALHAAKAELEVARQSEGVHAFDCA